MADDSNWMQALGRLRGAGLAYDAIAHEIGASSRSVRRWDQYRVRVLQGGAPAPEREASPIPAFATALVNLAQVRAAAS
mgnify:CR=1 FL=1